MTTVASLKVLLGADVRGFQSGMAGAVGALRRFGGVVASAAGIGGVGALAAQALRTADQIDAMSTSLGIGARDMLRLRFVAGQIGIEFESTARSIGKMILNLQDTGATGRKAGEALAEMGLSIEELRAAAPLDALRQIMTGGSRIEDQNRRLSLLGDIFGERLGPAMERFVALGDEGMAQLFARADELGIWSDGTVRRLDEIGDKLNQVGVAAEMAGGRMIAAFGPQLISALDATSKKLVEMDGSPNLGGAIQTAGAISGAVPEMPRALGVIGASVSLAIQRLFGGDVGTDIRGRNPADATMIEILREIAGNISIRPLHGRSPLEMEAGRLVGGDLTQSDAIVDLLRQGRSDETETVRVLRSIDGRLVIGVPAVAQ